tara:strand:+ start:233 stop:1297 length:1065 start_codon:yes stop_codon:yes gene_type:complete
MARNNYTITFESVTAHIRGETYTIKRGDPNFAKAKAACLAEDWASIPKLISKGLGLFDWLGAFPGWKYQDNHIVFNGDRLPPGINKRMFDLEKKGESPQNLAKFWELLQLNPSWRSVQQTYDFLRHQGISIDEEGYILAYKGIKSDWFDCHTGKTHKNTVGAVIHEPRNKISDDPNQGCHYGLHTGALSYARGHAQGRVVIVRVHPRDVVCIPKDSSFQKMRCCEYTVVGVWNGVAPLGMTTDTRKDEALAPATRKAAPPAPAAAPTTPSKGKTQTAAPATAPVGNEPWRTFGDLSDKDLKDENMANLRKYASRVLRIVGASKLRKFQVTDGGKEIGLVSVIISVRQTPPVPEK